jgi:hypothetical protein
MGTDTGRVTVYARQTADAEELLAAVSALGTGDTFCAAAPDDEDADGYGDGAYSATISDTVATFVIEVERDPLAAELPPALASDTSAPGWKPGELTAYQISVPEVGPGAQRLRYRLAKAVLSLTDGVLVSASGQHIALDTLADSAWGSLW